MKVIIAGSRDVTNMSYVLDAIAIAQFDITEVVSGMARGADKLGHLYGKTMRIPVSEWHADWDEYGKSAGYKRNVQMGEYADALIAIWDGQSKGTKYMIDIMKKLNKPVSISYV